MPQRGPDDFPCYYLVYSGVLLCAGSPHSRSDVCTAVWIPLCLKAAYHFGVVFSECDVTFLSLGGLETQEGDVWPF